MSRLRLAVAAGCALVLSACSLTTEVATQREYAAGDGVRIEVSDSVALENVRVVSDGTDSYILGLAKNTSNSEVEVNITSAGSEIDSSIDLAAETAFNFGDTKAIEDGSLIATTSPLEPGSTVPVEVSAGSDSIQANIPVLSACQNGYEEVFPNAQCKTPAPAGESDSEH